MERKLTLEYWIEDSSYEGRLKEVPGVFIQGETLEELEDLAVRALLPEGDRFHLANI